MQSGGSLPWSRLLVFAALALLVGCAGQEAEAPAVALGSDTASTEAAGQPEIEVVEDDARRDQSGQVPDGPVLSETTGVAGTNPNTEPTASTNTTLSTASTGTTGTTASTETTGASGSDQTSSTETDGDGSSRPCVRTVTTIPGDEYCPGYPTTVTPASCPGWARSQSARPVDGWLGTNSSRRDSLGRSGELGFDDQARLDQLIAAAAPHVPAGFSLASSRVLGYTNCPDAPSTFQLSYTNAAGDQVYVFLTRLLDQLDWSVQKPSGTIERSQSNGSELATGATTDGTTVRAWFARADGTMVQVTAYGSNAETYPGFPTTIPRPTTSVGAEPTSPPGPSPLSRSEAANLAAALA